MIIPAAFALDMFLGDPRRLPHPVRWMGNAIAATEPGFRKIPVSAVTSGTLFTACLVIGTWALTAFILNLAHALHPALETGLEVVLVFYCLSVRTLNDAALEVFSLLKADQVDAARAKIALIVGRDVEKYQGPDIARAAVETVAENFVDGVLSPLLWAAIGGAPLAMAFKMVSTLDSMVGYKNEKYFHFGKAAARLDDLFNYLPARISMPLIASPPRSSRAPACVRSAPHSPRAPTTPAPTPAGPRPPLRAPWPSSSTGRTITAGSWSKNLTSACASARCASRTSSGPAT